MKKYFLLPTLFLGWIFVLYEYAISTSNGVIVDRLLHTLAIGPDSISLISAAYYLPYIVMQIPAGLLIDRMGIRRCWPLALAAIALGCYIFASSSSTLGTSIGRMFMGFGSAFGWVGVIRIIYRVSRDRNNAFYIGASTSVCMLGAIIGQAPWLYLTQFLGSWQQPYFLATFAGVVICLLIYTFAHDYHHSKSPMPSVMTILKSMLPLIRSKLFWVLVFYLMAVSLPQNVFVILWANEFFKRNYYLPAELTATMLSLFWLGGLIGAPFVGYISDKIADQKRFLLWIGIITIMSMIVLLYLQPPSIILVATILFVMGFFANASVIIYAITTKIAVNTSIASTISVMNMVNMTGAALVQLTTGYILSSTMTTDNIGNFVMALSIIPAIIILAMFGLVFLKKIPK